MILSVTGYILLYKYHAYILNEAHGDKNDRQAQRWQDVLFRPVLMCGVLLSNTCSVSLLPYACTLRNLGFPEENVYECSISPEVKHIHTGFILSHLKTFPYIFFSVQWKMDLKGKEISSWISLLIFELGLGDTHLFYFIFYLFLVLSPQQDRQDKSFGLWA